MNTRQIRFLHLQLMHIATDRLFKICREPDLGRQGRSNQGLHRGDRGFRPRAGLRPEHRPGGVLTGPGLTGKGCHNRS
jgi:hypothetical protein